MIIQPRGFKRKRSYSALMEKITDKIETIAAKYDCSKSFVIATILAEALNIKDQPSYASEYERVKKASNRKRSKTKIVRFELRKRAAS